MGKLQPIVTIPGRSSLSAPSVLEQFTLGFEFNKTLQEVRRDVRVRTHKK